MEDLPCFPYRKLDLKFSEPMAENRKNIYEPLDAKTSEGSEQEQGHGVKYLLCHLLGRCVADVFGTCTAGAAAAAGGVAAQQVGVDGICQLVISCCEIASAEGLCTGVVCLLSAPLQRHQELLQRPGDRKDNRFTIVIIIMELH